MTSTIFSTTAILSIILATAGIRSELTSDDGARGFADLNRITAAKVAAASTQARVFENSKSGDPILDTAKAGDPILDTAKAGDPILESVLF